MIISAVIDEANVIQQFPDDLLIAELTMRNKIDDLILSCITNQSINLDDLIVSWIEKKSVSLEMILGKIAYNKFIKNNQNILSQVNANGNNG